ncbi:unnamed protein product [Danaus chrysippus]|uniref:(African queen) hypothetical protein n=1 Tax=Danaus chrysippus TaxID=151541 RepID=A0A8J2VU72_9NEOP|nr:unnamed protein product [Danaus chrysippus]
MLFIVLTACICSCLSQSINAQCISAYNGLAADNMAWQAGNALAWEATSAPWNPSCAGPSAYSGLNYALNEFGAGYSPSSLAASYGGGLAVTSASPISPTGVSMTSENAYEGPLSVAGTMPFLGAVALEGSLPTGGAGAVSYSCGNGNVAMINEDYAGYSMGPLGYGAAVNGPAYGYNGFGPAAYEGYNGLSSQLAVEAGLAGPNYGYNLNNARLGGCGCGAVY